jgi:hypothetical protein
MITDRLNFIAQSWIAGNTYDAMMGGLQLRALTAFFKV